MIFVIFISLFLPVAAEYCSPYCNENGDFQERFWCTKGYCCGWKNAKYCCVDYYDRYFVDSVSKDSCTTRTNLLFDPEETPNTNTNNSTDPATGSTTSQTWIASKYGYILAGIVALVLIIVTVIALECYINWELKRKRTFKVGQYY